MYINKFLSYSLRNVQEWRSNQAYKVQSLRQRFVSNETQDAHFLILICRVNPMSVWPNCLIVMIILGWEIRNFRSIGMGNFSEKSSTFFLISTFSLKKIMWKNSIGMKVLGWKIRKVLRIGMGNLYNQNKLKMIN